MWAKLSGGRGPWGARLHVLLIVFVGLAVYSNTFESPFVFDDTMYIVENPLVKDFGYVAEPGRAAEHPYTEEVVRRYLVTRRAAYLTFWLNYKLGRLGTAGYHAFNLAVHLSVSLLIYAFIVLAFRTPFLAASRLAPRARPIALFAGLFFAAHPVCTEGVTYITQRFGQMATAFYLLSLVSYIGFRLKRGGAGGYGFYTASFASALVAMKSKETAFTLPLAITMCEFFFFPTPAEEPTAQATDSGSRIRRRLVLLAPFLATSLIIPAEYIRMSRGSTLEDITRLQTDIPRSVYLFTELRVLVTYMRLFFLPVNQNVDYDYPVYWSLFDVPVMASLAVVAVMLGLGIYAFRRSHAEPELRLVSFGVFWLFLALSVESGIVPISERIFEYRMYLPMTGAAAGIAVFLFFMSGRGLPEKILAPVLVALVVLNAGAAHARNDVWGSEIALWGDSVKKSPNKVRPQNNLAKAYRNAGLIEKSFEYFGKAASLDPEAAEPRFNIGTLYLQQGMYKEAVGHLKEALLRDPEFIEAHVNLGVALLNLRKPEAAVEHFNHALRLRPGYVKALNNLGNAYMATGDFGKAAEYYGMALEKAPHSANIWYNLGNARLAGGDTEEAIRCFTKAIEINPGYVGSYLKLANAMSAKGLVKESEALMKRARELSSDAKP